MQQHGVNGKMQAKRSDYELLRAWSKGDACAGNELIDRHGVMLLRFFRRKLDQHSEDLTQKTFAIP